MVFLIPVRAEAGEVIITVVNWFSPVGQLNGNTTWMNGTGYNYNGRKSGGLNYPMMLSDTQIPNKSVSVGSADYLRLIYSGAREELLRMKSTGIDVALWDSMPMPNYDPTQPISYSNCPMNHFLDYLEWLRAASEVGMKVGMFMEIKNQSGDYPKGYVLNRQEWERVIGGILENLPTDSRSDAIWKINGVPALIHFGTDSDCGCPPEKGAPAPDGGWRNVIQDLRAQGKRFYFIADMRTHVPQKNDWKGIVDALYSFNPAGPGTYLADSGAAMKSNFDQFGIPYYFSSSPGYYLPKVAYVEPDFRRIHDVYLRAIETKAEKVHIMTWNDLNEDTDIFVSAYKGKCLMDIYSYYNAWYKTGVQSELKEEKLIICYPHSIPRQVNTKAPVWGGGKWRANSYSPKVFYWANLKQPRKVSISATCTMEIPNGLSMGEFPELVCECDHFDVSVNGRTMRLPGVPVSEKEDLHFRYVDLMEGCF